MITQKLTEDMKVAMKAGDKLRLSVVRMLLSELKNERIAQGEDLDEASERKVLTGYAKKRREAMEAARAGGREEVAAREQQELDITMAYLPPQLSEADLRVVVRKHIETAGATGPQAFGVVMKSVMAEVGGQADGKVVSALVRELMG
ncbi:MAG: GatB/YqeY domain-containing protein [Candidatus Krumholzibacteria bacterium]|nr:GatB/YqeY domain-containing protein [Candidatus Krumholzibacteria bacterium]MDH4337673.1 GatB/YqeY domain-containing protein [Candidatus Krumholzibacteria bacterium]MDH5270247.1 GatB/YqeY domain-containing protein [Candidatus Krumholzibacteria bacterium]